MTERLKAGREGVLPAQGRGESSENPASPGEEFGQVRGWDLGGGRAKLTGGPSKLTV